MSAKKSPAKLFQGDDVEVPPILWPLMKEIMQQVEKGGGVTIVFDSTDQPSAKGIRTLSKQLRGTGIKVAVNPESNKPSLE